jgi:hypothetical protein
MKKIVPIFLAVTYLWMSFFVGCSKDSNPANSTAEPPELPPAQSMSFDLSTFSTNSAGKQAVVLSKNNFANAASRAILINTVVIAALAIPAATLAAALSQQPALEQDGKFHWIYQTTTKGFNLEADLAGHIDIQAKRIIWEMFITCNNAGLQLDNFKWYEGFVNLENSEGEWTIYDFTQPDSSVKVATINWIYNNREDAQTIFKNIYEGAEGYGDTLTYSVDGKDCQIVYVDKSADETAIIAWNSETTAGYLQVPHYNDGQPAYWNEDRNDI